MQRFFLHLYGPTCPTRTDNYLLSDVPNSDKFIFFFILFLPKSLCLWPVDLGAFEILGGRSAQLWPPLVRHQLFFEFKVLCVVALHLTREQMQQRHHFPHEQESLRLVGPVALGVLESNSGRSDQLQPSPVHAFALFW